MPIRLILKSTFFISYDRPFSSMNVSLRLDQLILIAISSPTDDDLKYYWF